MATALVTGGLGTIGSCLSARLVKQGHRVIVYDNKELGTLENLAYYLSSKEIEKIEFHFEDIMERDKLAKAMSRADICYHMAATLGTLRVVKQPVRMLDVNIYGAHLVVKEAMKNDIPIVTCSTSMVYGNNPKAVVTEQDSLFIGGNVEVGLWWYAVSKIAEESYARATMLEDPSAKILILRPFNVVAPVQSAGAGFVVPRFISAALKGEPLLIYGEGTQMRTFTWAEDFVDAATRLVELDKCWGETINIGATEEISIKDLAHMIVEKTNSSSEIKHIDPQELYNNQFTEIDRRIPDVSKLKSFTGDVYPQTGVERVVEAFIDYYKSKNIAKAS